MNYEYDTQSKQYRKKRHSDSPIEGEASESGGNIYSTASAAENRRPKSYHKPWTHSRKKWKLLFWIFFTIGFIVWAIFMVHVFKQDHEAPFKDSGNPMKRSIQGF